MNTRNIKLLVSKFSMILSFLLLSLNSSSAQTQITISGAQRGYPIGIPEMCDGGSASDEVSLLPKTITKDLDLSGFFNIVDPASFVESPRKCNAPDGIQYSDWSVIGVDYVVKGKITNNGSSVIADFYLIDVAQKKPILGKRYEISSDQVKRVAHRFANEIIGLLTGERGVFGSKLLYVSKVGRYKEIFISELDGADVKQLTRDKGLAMSPAFSPNGKNVVFTSYKTRRPELYILDSNGGSARQITSREGLEIGAKFTNQGLMTSAEVRNSSQIVLMSMKGEVLKQVTDSGSINISPSLSPDGSQVAFCSNRGGNPQIYIAPTSGGEAKRVSFSSSNYCTSPSWSPKGDKIAFVCRDAGFHIYVSSPTGERPIQLTFSGSNEDPSWSPDGRYLLYSSTAGRGGRSIMIASVQTGVTKQLTVSSSEDSQPSWGPPID